MRARDSVPVWSIDPVTPWYSLHGNWSIPSASELVTPEIRSQSKFPPRGFFVSIVARWDDTVFLFLFPFFFFFLFFRCALVLYGVIKEGNTSIVERKRGIVREYGHIRSSSESSDVSSVFSSFSNISVTKYRRIIRLF